VPVEGEVFHVPAPPGDPTRPGGVGLDDLKDLLESQDRIDDVELPGWGSVMSSVLESGKEGASTRMLDVRVERAGALFGHRVDYWLKPTVVDVGLMNSTGLEFSRFFWGQAAYSSASTSDWIRLSRMGWLPQRGFGVVN